MTTAAIFIISKECHDMRGNDGADIRYRFELRLLGIEQRVQIAQMISQVDRRRLPDFTDTERSR